MTQGDLAANLEQGVDQTGDKAAASFPRLFQWQVTILAAFVLRRSAGFFAPDRRGENSEAIGYLQPFFIAFLIWPVIYGFQGVFSVWQLFQRPGRVPARRLEAIQKMAPGWLAMSLITVAWNFAPTLWLAGLGLTAVVVCLYIAWLAVVGEKESWQDYLMLNVGITMHLGWGTAACLLTWNGWVAEVTSSPVVNIGFLFCELGLAAGLSSFLALRHSSPLLVCMVAWAVTWIGTQTLIATGPRLEKYNAELGESGRYTLGIAELLLAVALVGVAVRAKKQL